MSGCVYSVSSACTCAHLTASLRAHRVWRPPVGHAQVVGVEGASITVETAVKCCATLTNSPTHSVRTHADVCAHSHTWLANWSWWPYTKFFAQLTKVYLTKTSFNQLLMTNSVTYAHSSRSIHYCSYNISNIAMSLYAITHTLTELHLQYILHLYTYIFTHSLDQQSHWNASLASVQGDNGRASPDC